MTANNNRFQKILDGIRKHGYIWICLYSWRFIMCRLRRFASRQLFCTDKRMFHIECIHDKKPPQFAPVTAAEIEALIARHPFYLGPYYAGRWEYYKEVINLVLGILPNVKTILELGPYNLPLIKGADTMDIDPDIPNLTYCHDASMSPWPIVDGKYDLFIGLQVWEHLKDKQTEAFHEVMRISRMAVLSFPYKWDRPGNCHHGIDDSVIEKWTAGVKARKRILANKRIICFYDFETDVRRR